MAEICLLQQLQRCSSITPLLRLLLSLLLEDLPSCSPTYKYHSMGALDSDDLLCVPGVVLYDGGPQCPATSAAEFRVLWERRHSSCSSNRHSNAAAAAAALPAAAPAKSKAEGGGPRGPPTSVFDLLPTTEPCRRPLPIKDKGDPPATAAAAVAAAGAQDPHFSSPQRNPTKGPSSHQQEQKTIGGPSGAPLFATPAPLNRMKRAPPGLGGRALAGSLESEAPAANTEVGGGAPGGGGPLQGGGSLRGPSVDLDGDGSEGIASPCAVSPHDLRGAPLLGPPSPFSSGSSSSSTVFFSQQHQQQQQRLIYSWEDAEWLQSVESCLSDVVLQGGPCKSRGPQGGPCTCREVLVVDVQTDGALRRRVSEAQKLVGYSPVGGGPRGGPPASRQRRRVEAIKRLVLKAIRAPSNSAERMEINRIAETQYGFVPLGAVRFGESRHRALLFKVNPKP